MLMAMNEVHTSRAAKRYLDMLDLESGRGLFAKSMGFWPHYPDIIKNRKTCILEMTEDAIRNGGITQVAVFGAGFDALSVDVASRFEGCRIFEIDVANMDEKNRIIGLTDPLLGDRIQCITLNISEPENVMGALMERGWDADAPSLAVFEGISYYLPERTLWSVISKFGTTASRQNRIILEYLVPSGEIQTDRVPVAEYIFDLIVADSELDGITRYGAKDIRERIVDLGGVMLRHYGMMEMQKSRSPENTAVFPTSHSGWIRVCDFAL